ncbi:MAG TPA: transaldolase [Gammaproteobacteria bacterium]|nr:transaldolase [Gammaproteobacteria bacterium]
MTSRLESLSSVSTVVADTGEIDMIRRFKPVDCTTNPSLLLKAAQLDAYRNLVTDAVEWGRGRSGNVDEEVDAIADRLAVTFGRELLGIVPGYVSTEVDAALSFDTAGTIDKAHSLIEQYRELKVPTERVLIKVASTWEGVEAARQLQSEGIKCNMTLIFSLAQAVACAEAGAFLVSPFVGRITDWYKANTGSNYAPDEDPGVLSVRSIYDYFKSHGLETVVMAASFRTTGQVEALAGCDRLTISPALLEELDSAPGEVPQALDPEKSAAKRVEPVSADEVSFRWQLNEDAMATEKLADGIRRFHEDSVKLKSFIRTLV